MEYSGYHQLSNRFMFDTIFRFDNIPQKIPQKI